VRQAAQLRWYVSCCVCCISLFCAADCLLWLLTWHGWPMQVAHDIETAISIVHNFPAQPWLKVLHLKAPWATRQGRQLHEARMRLSSKCYEPLYEHVKTLVRPVPDVELSAARLCLWH